MNAKTPQSLKTEALAIAIASACSRYTKPYDIAIAVKVALREAGYQITKTPKR